MAPHRAMAMIEMEMHPQTRVRGRHSSPPQHRTLYGEEDVSLPREDACRLADGVCSFCLLRIPARLGKHAHAVH